MNNTKISLYFKRETMNEILRLKTLLTLTGQLPNEIPDTNEYINGIIAYTLHILKEYPAERERLQDFINGKIRPTTREDEQETIESNEDPEEFENTKKPYEERGTARFLYKISKDEETELEEIAKLSKIETTKGILIKTITEFCLREKIDRKSITFYSFLSTLYRIKIKTIINLLSAKDEKEENLKKIDKEDLEALRRITWDHGTFETFKNAVEKERKFIYTLKSGALSGGKLHWIFGIRPKTFYKYIEETNSKASNFNYLTAYIGFTMSLSIIEEELSSITEGIMQINKIKNYAYKDIINDISHLITISDRINNNPEI